MRHAPPERVGARSGTGERMSYSWGASHGSARMGGVAFERARATLRGAGVPHRPADLAAPLSGPPGRRPEVEDVMPEQQRVADELAPMVEVWQRLLAQHVPDRAGRCRTCTKGGTGLPTTPWPCVIHGIADMARRTYDARRGRAAAS